MLDLFCGCGGLSYGFELSGYNIVLGIDNDKKALETFEANHKGAKTLCGDITAVHFSDIQKILNGKRIDIIVGGPPCQGMSLSGPRKFDDPRNKLYLSYIRLVEEIKPKAFVIENVPGLVSLFNGQIKDSIIKKLSDLGYKVTYKILCSADYGVPQKRERVFIVGIRKDIGAAFDFSLLKNSIKNISPTPLSKVVESIVDDKYFFSQKAVDGMSKKRETMNKGRAQDLSQPSNTVGAHLAKVSLNSIDPVLQIGARYRRFTPREVARIQSFPETFELVGTESAQYRALGNAIAPVMFWYIANAVSKYLKQKMNMN